MKTMKKFFMMTLAGLVALCVQLGAQVQTDVPPAVPGAKPVSVEHIKVHGTSLEGNLEGDAVDREVLVFLPPSYPKQKSRRYPVVYALHGYSIGAEQWTHEIHVPQTIEGAFAQGAQEMIIVIPDSKTVHNGSMYSSSVTTGNFEQFIAHDLVAYIDAHYRTIPTRLGRGLVGHSMGGYGATRIGMKHSDVFSSLYIMSPCCLSPRPASSFKPEDGKALEAVKTPEDSAKLGFFQRAQLATAAAWSPDPKNPPLYLDLPMKDGALQAEIYASTAPFRSTWVIRMVYESMLASCMTFLMRMESQTALRCTKVHTRVRWLTVFRIMWFPFSAKIFALRETADSHRTNRRCGDSGVNA